MITKFSTSIVRKFLNADELYILIKSKDLYIHGTTENVARSEVLRRMGTTNPNATGEVDFFKLNNNLKAVTNKSLIYNGNNFVVISSFPDNLFIEKAKPEFASLKPIRIEDSEGYTNIDELEKLKKLIELEKSKNTLDKLKTTLSEEIN